MTKIKSQKHIRAMFWGFHPELDAAARKRGTRSKGQNEQTPWIRAAFAAFVEGLARDGAISEDMARRVTL
jgi:hypothetical protein